LDGELGYVVYNGVMATGPITGYVFQYRLIKASNSIGSFSIDICGILLFANILRLNFFLFKRYEIVLVLQSLFMIVMQVSMHIPQMLLLSECSKYPQVESSQVQSVGNVGEAEENPKRKQRFWRWVGFERYCKSEIM
jgi:hypothetical protein